MLYTATFISSMNLAQIDYIFPSNDMRNSMRNGVLIGWRCNQLNWVDLINYTKWLHLFNVLRKRYTMKPDVAPENKKYNQMNWQMTPAWFFNFLNGMTLFFLSYFCKHYKLMCKRLWIEKIWNPKTSNLFAQVYWFKFRSLVSMKNS